MDFFEHQDQARRKSGQLVLFFLIGVGVTVLLVNLLGYALYWGFIRYLGVQADGSLGAWLTSDYSWQLSLAAFLVIAVGSLGAYLQLRKGGQVVARWAGAQPVDYDTGDAGQRRFINVVEEMSIASGTPVPSLYVMPNESSINAFVAGYQPDQAILVVSQGALDHLDRDELQGVIGHEYSHILNGDMRLNIRLMAVLAGLVQIGQLGQWLVGWRMHSHRSSRREDFAIPLLGLGLLAIGYVGVLTGRIIKAAVSRQREYLADASSVQFTRNPDGIAGALYKIREHATGALLMHRHAEDMSHFCFGEAVSLSQRLATHPPLDDRIKRVNPTFLARAKHRSRQSESADDAIARSQPDAFESVMGGAAVMGLAGQVTPGHLDYARQLYKHIPEQVRAAVHQSAGARAFCYSQIMLASPGHEQPILDRLKQEDANSLDSLKRLWPFAKKLDAQLRLPILDMAIPVLKRYSEPDRLVFLDRIERLILADNQTRLPEWILAAQLRHHLQPGREKAPGRSQAFKHAGPAVVTLLSALVYQNRQPEQAEAVYDRVIAPFDFPNKTLKSPDQAGFRSVTEALEDLQDIAFFWRKSVLQACVDIIQADGAVHQDEYELIRTVADCLGCPMPPLVEREWTRDGVA